MSTVAEIQAAVHRLSADELAELERFVRAERNRKQLPVAKRAPSAKGALALDVSHTFRREAGDIGVTIRQTKRPLRTRRLLSGAAA